MTDKGWLRTNAEAEEMEQSPMQGPPKADNQSDETPSENPEQAGSGAAQ